MTKLICEIGLNHFGNFDIAKKLCDNLSNIDVWGVKFQYRNLKNFFSYKITNNEIGKEIINLEIKKSYLSPRQIIFLSKRLRNCGKKVGISFFSKKDIKDFKNFEFDFYKIPSAVNTDLLLLKELKKKKKLTFISLGCKSHSDIVNLKKKTQGQLSKKISFFHCVSNYPLNPLNANLSYIDKLKKIFPDNHIGYSSHESDIYNSILSLTKKISFLERHVTLNKDFKGIDISSSSDINEIQTLAYYCTHFEKIYLSRENRVLNQGEIINLQNLGKGYVLKKNKKKNTTLYKNDINEVFTSSSLDINKFIGKKILKNVKKNETISLDFFKTKKKSKFLFKNIALPIRPFDYKEIDLRFKFNKYEFHLSYTDVLRLNYNKFDKKFLRNKSFSVHAPDYCDNLNILDIFSNNELIKKKSKVIIDKCVEFCKFLKKASGNSEVFLISSFSQKEKKKTNMEFYKKLKKFIDYCYKKNKVAILPQWLPPLAWYFGGSVKLDVFNKPNDLEFLRKLKMNICMDLSHFILSCNFYDAPIRKIFYKYFKLYKHFHISDAIGIDGEGVSLGKGELTKTGILNKLLKSKNTSTLVLETWQGHLNNFDKFEKDLFFLKKINNQK
jgi:sialic acid synthase SpsE